MCSYAFRFLKQKQCHRKNKPKRSENDDDRDQKTKKKKKNRNYTNTISSDWNAFSKSKRELSRRQSHYYRYAIIYDYYEL